MKNQSPLVSIGMPVYDGEPYLRKALESLLSQSYQNFELIISDNASSDNTEGIIEEYKRRDARIRHYKNKNNIGAVKNTQRVFGFSKGSYFMWASHDDIWDKKFIETGMKTLLKYPDYHAWFCTIKNIDNYGRVIRKYQGFSRFTSTGSKAKDICRYLLEPECMGKANILYSIYKKDILKEFLREYQLADENVWGGDMCFNLAFLSKYNLIATDEVLFSKRFVRPNDQREKVDTLIIKHPSRYIFPSKESIKYFSKYYEDLRNTPYRYIVLLVVMLRIPVAFRNDYLTREYYHKMKEKINRKYLSFRNNLTRILESFFPKRVIQHYYWEKIKVLEKKAHKKEYQVYQMASLYKRLENYERSRKLFGEIIETTTNNHLLGGACFHIGTLEMTKGKKEEAKDFFETTLKMIPDHIQAKKMMEALNSAEGKKQTLNTAAM